MKSILGMAAALIAINAQAQTVLGPSSRHLRLEQLPVSAPADSAQNLIGGRVIDRQEFPGVFYTRQGNSRCTGTLVGSRVVATAAHCVSNGGSLSLSYQEKTYSGKCTHHSSYKRNSTADYALCLLTEAVPDAIAEAVNTDGARLKKGNKLQLVGYGCTNSSGNGGNDGLLRTGLAPITALPSGTNYDIVTKGTVALCYGDSGGPSFYVDEVTGERFQTGINSRGDIATTSYLSSLHVQTAQDFYKSWAASKGVSICGIDADAVGCRQQAEPLPEACKGSAAQVSMLAQCTNSTTPPAADMCKQAMLDVQSCLTARGLQ